MLVRRFETIYMEMKKRYAYLGAYISRTERSYDRLKLHIETMEDLYHRYRIIKYRRVNLW